MLVFVKNKHGENLMPCKPSKARKLLKQKKAKIILPPIDALGITQPRALE